MPTPRLPPDALRNAAHLALLLQRKGVRPSIAELRAQEACIVQAAALSAGETSLPALAVEIIAASDVSERVPSSPLRAAGARGSLLVSASRGALRSLRPEEGPATPSTADNDMALSLTRLPADAPTDRGDALSASSHRDSHPASFMTRSRARVSPKRSLGAWGEVVALDSALAAAEAADEAHRTLAARATFQRALSVQVQEREAAVISARRAVEEDAARARTEEAAVKRAALESARVRAEAAAKHIAETSAWTEAEAARREKERAHRLASEHEALERVRAATADDARAAAEKAARNRELMRRALVENEAYVAAAAVRLSEQKALELQQAHAAAAASAAREAERSAAVAARANAMAKKLEAMGDPAAMRLKETRDEEVRAEAERVKREADADAARVLKAELTRAHVAEMVSGVAAQLVAKQSAAAAERTRAIKERLAKEADAVSFAQEEVEAKRRKSAAALALANDLAAQVVDKQRRALVPDDTPLERSLIATHVASRKAAIAAGATRRSAAA